MNVFLNSFFKIDGSQIVIISCICGEYLDSLFDPGYIDLLNLIYSKIYFINDFVYCNFYVNLIHSVKTHFLIYVVFSVNFLEIYIIDFYNVYHMDVLYNILLYLNNLVLNISRFFFYFFLKYF